MVKAHTFDNRRHMVTNFFVVTPPKLFSEFHGYDDNLGNLSSHLSEAYESFKGVDGTVLSLHKYVRASGSTYVAGETSRQCRAVYLYMLPLFVAMMIKLVFTCSSQTAGMLCCCQLHSER